MQFRRLTSLILPAVKAKSSGRNLEPEDRRQSREKRGKYNHTHTQTSLVFKNRAMQSENLFSVALYFARL